MKLSEFGFTTEELAFIRLACQMFSAQSVTVSDITPADRRTDIPDTNETPQKI
jgi:hypothetical protein